MVQRHAVNEPYHALAPVEGHPGGNRPPFRSEDLDPDAVKVVRKLLAAGHEAYLVGGCVRDLYLGRKPKDFDVATSATPDQIHKVFRNSRIIGRRFKLAHVFFGAKVIETSTFRTTPVASGDEDLLITQDNQWGTVEDDARRRDFTINGLFYDLEAGAIIDFVEGIDDLENGVIRTIGDAKTRFLEDPVRMVRAVKFAARLDFKVEAGAWNAMVESAPAIARCPTARVLEELYKLLRGGSGRDSFELLHRSGLLRHLWPDYLAMFEAQGGLALQSTTQERPEAHPVSAHLWRMLDALDQWVERTGQNPTNALMQSALFWPLVRETIEAGEVRQIEAWVDRTLHEVGTPFGVARRDREVARELMLARRKPGGSGSRRKPVSLDRDDFHEALVFLALAVEADTSGPATLAVWQDFARRASARGVHGSGGGDGGETGERKGRSGRSRNRRRSRGRHGKAPA